MHPLEVTIVKKNHQTTRSDRIHALFMRNARRFRDVAFAARIAGEQLETMAPNHQNYMALNSVVKAAAQQMQHLSTRGIKLARAEIACLMGGNHA